MSIEVKEIKDSNTSLGRHFAIWSSGDCRFIDYEGLRFSKESIDNYIGMGNPFPSDKFYHYDDLIGDFTNSDGSVTLCCEKEETADWVAEMISDLLWGGYRNETCA